MNINATTITTLTIDAARALVQSGELSAQALAEEPEWSEEEVEMLMKPGTESREPED